MRTSYGSVNAAIDLVRWCNRKGEDDDLADFIVDFINTDVPSEEEYVEYEEEEEEEEEEVVEVVEEVVEDVMEHGQLTVTSDGSFICTLSLGDATVPITMRTDGYVNATELCKAGGKLFAEYQRNKSTVAFIEALSLNMRIPIIRLITPAQGRYGGTWVHRKVAVHLAQWISPEFAIQVSNWVDELQKMNIDLKNQILEINTRRPTLTGDGIFACQLQLGDKIVPIQMREDGYINATELCKAGGKLYKNYIRNETTKEYIQALQTVAQMRAAELIQTKQGGTNQGTWVHRKVAIHLARWIFSRICSTGHKLGRGATYYRFCCSRCGADG